MLCEELQERSFPSSNCLDSKKNVSLRLLLPLLRMIPTGTVAFYVPTNLDTVAETPHCFWWEWLHCGFLRPWCGNINVHRQGTDRRTRNFIDNQLFGCVNAITESSLVIHQGNATKSHLARATSKSCSTRPVAKHLLVAQEYELGPVSRLKTEPHGGNSTGIIDLCSAFT